MKFYPTSVEGVGESDRGLKARVKLASNANFATEVKPPSERELTPHGARDLSMENEPQNEKNSRCRVSDSKNERITSPPPPFSLACLVPHGTGSPRESGAGMTCQPTWSIAINSLGGASM